jgi:hypothetical protein
MEAVTLELPDTVAQRLRPFSRWMPTIVEISLLPFKTSAAKTAYEVIEFLKSNPSAKAVHEYYVSDKAQGRMSELMSLNREGGMRHDDSEELDELLALASVITTLKAGLTNQEIA